MRSKPVVLRRLQSIACHVTNLWGISPSQVFLPKYFVLHKKNLQTDQYSLNLEGLGFTFAEEPVNTELITFPSCSRPLDRFTFSTYKLFTFEWALQLLAVKINASDHSWPLILDGCLLSEYLTLSHLCQPSLSFHSCHQIWQSRRSEWS